MHRNTILALTAAAFCAATAMLTSAGPLNPPPGAVSPTGRTLDEIFDAIGDLPAGDCGAAVPGVDRGDGTAAVTTPQFGSLPPIHVESYRVDVERPVDASGLPTGHIRLNGLTITKNTDVTSPILLDAMARNDTISSLVLVLHDSSGLPHFEVRLQNAIISNYVAGMIERCDGSHVQLEEVTLVYQRITWEHLDSGIEATMMRLN